GIRTVAIAADNGVVPRAIQHVPIHVHALRPPEYPRGSIEKLERGLEQRSDKQSLTYTGYFEVPRSGVYRFAVPDAVNGGIRLHIGDHRVLDAPAVTQGVIPLQ